MINIAHLTTVLMVLIKFGINAFPVFLRANSGVDSGLDSGLDPRLDSGMDSGLNSGLNSTNSEMTDFDPLFSTKIRFLIIDTFMFPLLTVYLAYNYRKQSDKLAELYFKTIRSEQLKRYEIDNTCATYREFFVNMA